MTNRKITPVKRCAQMVEDDRIVDKCIDPFLDVLELLSGPQRLRVALLVRKAAGEIANGLISALNDECETGRGRRRLRAVG